MYECNEFVDVVKKATKQCQQRGGDNGDRFDRMLKLVRSRRRVVQELGKQVFSHCRAYEDRHGKNETEALRLLEEIPLSSKIDLTNTDIQQTILTFEKAIRLLPYRWSEWSEMFRLMTVLINRAYFFYRNKYFLETYSDMWHVSNILADFPDQQEMISNLKDNPEMLRLVVSIKLHLVVEIDPHFAPQWLQDWLIPLQIRTEMISLTMPDIDGLCAILERLDVSKLIETIELFDKCFPPNEQKCIPIHEEDPENYFLNSKIHLSNERPELGRLYLAKDHIVPGEVLLAERPILATLFTQYLHEYCSYCYRNLITAWPCSGCDELVFCSAKCCRDAWNTFHRNECGIYGLILGPDCYYALIHVFRSYSLFQKEAPRCERELNEFPSNFTDAWHDYVENEEIRKKPKHQWNDDERRIVCRAVTSLLNHRGHRDLERESNHTALSVILTYLMIYRNIYDKAIIQDEEYLSSLVENLSTAISRTCTNGFCWAEERYPGSIVVKLASCICFLSSFFNHSCHANVAWEITEKGIKLSALRSITPGEPLTICYGPKRSTPFNERQIRLKHDYSFFCRCPACIVDAARFTNTMKCMAEQNGGHHRCPGPLIMNKFECCISCGRKPENISMARHISCKMMENNRKFQETMNKITRQVENGKTSKSFLENLLGWFQKAREDMSSSFPLSLTSSSSSMKDLDETDGFEIVIPETTKLVKEKNLAKLEKYFIRYHGWSYRSSYVLFNQCSMLIYAYNHAGYDIRVFGLLKPLYYSIEEIIPELIDNNLLFIIKKLDYLCRFFHHLIIVSSMIDPDQMEFSNIKGLMVRESIRELIQNFLDLRDIITPGLANDDDQDHDPVLTIHCLFWLLVPRLNHLLFDILHYDLNKKGNFFPKLHGCIIKGDDAAETLDNFTELERVNDLELTDAERYFRRIYEDCRRRISELDNLLANIC